jgi:ABC-type microcin C transport system permease subunit YejE
VLRTLLRTLHLINSFLICVATVAILQDHRGPIGNGDALNEAGGPANPTSSNRRGVDAPARRVLASRIRSLDKRVLLTIVYLYYSISL